MDEYINKTELLFEMATSLIPQDYKITRAYAIVKDVIKKAPTADVVPVVHGEWETVYSDQLYQCSNCKKTSEPTDFCPHCGADMSGGK